jgi:prepilin-type N-terminal cleavage/methylation domain-containing protein
MLSKKCKGVTLVELILTIAILSIVITAIATTVFGTSSNIVANAKLEEDQYNARMALLAITREVHHGYESVNAAADGSKLEVRNGTDGVDFEFDGTTLTSTYTAGYTSTVYPITLDLDDVEFIELDTPNGDDSIELNYVSDNEPDGSWLYIYIKCRGIDGPGGEGLELKTTISTKRIAD